MSNNCDLVNRTIYMTYKNIIPEFVFNRWKLLNKEYKMKLSLDNNCIHFLKKNFNDYIVELFLKIPCGIFKADLWRLCKLYICGGVYADVDLVPYLDIDKLDKENNIIKLMTEEQYKEYGKELRKEYRENNKLKIN